MTKKRHYCQSWFCPPKARHSRWSQQIWNHWLSETVLGFQYFGLPRAADFTADFPLTEDA